MIRISDLNKHEGKTVSINGWLYGRTDKGKLQFLLIRDGTGTVQCVIFEDDVSGEVYQKSIELTQESSLIVTGKVKEDKRAPGGYELSVSDLSVIQKAKDDYPIQLKEHGVEHLMKHRHLWLRSSQQQSILRIRAEIIRSSREWLDTHGFINLDTPIITPLSVEGTTTLFPVDYFGEEVYLTQSGQLYNEALAMAFGRVYSCGPVFRAERSKTRRHLTEFWMIEPEIAFCDLAELMEIEEQFIAYIVANVIKNRREDLINLEQDISMLEKVVPPFPKITYDDALDLLQSIRDQLENPNERDELSIEWGSDFGAPHDAAISGRYDKPVFITHYPTEAKAFYMQPKDGRPDVSLSADLLAPDGYGEIIGGGQRIANPEVLLDRLSQHNLNQEIYEWYTDLRRFGSVNHSGFGMGVERLTTWICGRRHIRETIAFPRLYKYINM